ncbi:hypothetical protein JG687_00014821 [Phytophthora cactorum]|nr:hypothetical protein Pcac1_g15830 [Phytophthora cactorum]KAG2998462.1 hypothetical protein PC120_g21154 [Phytophthora cactorum]KAG6949504.1 hypothetical protein JG687_00014821 [Phytophthora cactorum]
MSNPTDRTEATSAPIDRTSDEGELPQTGDGARADDVGSVTTTSQPPSTSQCESTPRLGPDPVGASTVRGDPREDAPEPEAAYESDEMEDAIRARRRVQTTRGRRKTPPVIWTSNINIVHDLDDDDEHNMIVSDAENDGGASGDDDSDSEGEVDKNTDDG